MAKKEKFTSGSLNLDSDLDLDNFDFGDTSSKSIKDDRKPLTKAAGNFAKGTIGGMKSTVTNSATIAKAIRAGMPREYGDVMDRTGEVTSQLSSLYNDANSKIKPELQKISKQIDKLVPEEMKRTKGVLAKIKKALGADDSSYTPTSEEEINEGNIQSGLAEVFTVQAEDNIKARAEDRAERKLDKKVDAKRFEVSFGLLNSINVNMARMANYTTKVNSAFQKKSLELQYRSYYVQRDMLRTSQEMMKMLEARTAAIQKNTALPDFVKRNMSEDFKEMTRRKLVGQAGSFLSRGLKNVAKAGKEKMNDFLFTLQQASMGLDMVGDAKDMMQTQREMAESMGMEDTGKAGMAGDMAGSLAMTSLAKRLGKKINSKYFQAGSKGSNTLFNILSFLNNGEKETRKLQSKYLSQDFGDESKFAGIKNFAKGGLSNFIDLFLAGANASGSLDKKMGSGIGKLHESANYNQLTQKSITTIIPGFLSRIHAEIRALRTNSEPGELLQFDQHSGKFAMSGKIEKSIKTHLQKTINEGGLSYNIDSIHNQIAQGQSLSKGASEALRRKIHEHTFTNKGLDVEDLMHPDFTKGMSKKQAREIRMALSSRFNKKSDDFAKNRSELVKAGRVARSSIKDLDSEIQSLIDAGHEEELVKLDIIKETDSGFEVKKDAYRKLSEAGFIKDGRFKTSDIFAKTDIKGFSGAKALNAIKNTKVFNWLYKKGKGDEGEHVGPMAQDVRRNFGSETAPGGKAIDVVSMNGANMAAIQELDKKIKNIGKGSSDKNILLSINENTRSIVERLDNMARINFGIPKLDASGLKEAIKLHGENIHEKIMAGKDYVSDKIKTMKKPEGFLDHAKNIAGSAGAMLASVFETGVKGSVKLGENIKKGVENAKDPAMKAFKSGKDAVASAGKWFFEKGTVLAGKIFDSVSNATTDLMKNKLPAGWAEVVKGASWLSGKAKNMLDTPKDIYMAGKEQPVMRAILMKAGAYFDQVSKKPIRRPSDIKGPVVDQDGNLVLSVDDIEAGIYDVEGKPIQSILGKMKDFVQNAGSIISDKASKLLGGFKGIAGKAGTGIKNLGNRVTGGIGFAGQQAVTLLTQIRDVLNGRLPGVRSKFPSLEKATGGTALSTVAGATSTTTMNLASSASDLFQSGKEKLGSIKDRVKGSGIGGKLSGWFGKAAGLKDKAMSTVADKLGSKDGERKPGLFSKIGGFFGKLGKSNQTQQQSQQGPITDPHQIHATEGQREGGVEQQVAMQAAREAKRKETKAAQADLGPRYKGKNIFDVATDAAKGAFDTVIGGLSNLAGLVFGGGKGGLLRGAGSLAMTAARGAGSLAMGAGRLALGTVARFGAGAVMGGVGTALGGIGGTAMAAGGALMSAGGALLTALASPIGLGVLATAAVGYGLYKGYKFLTRNKASDITKVRMLQYGLTSSESSHYHDIYNLEAELLENGVVFRGQQADLEKKKMNLKNILEIFDLTEDSMNTEHGQNFVTWFSSHFKPVFLTHLTALRAVDSKLSLAEVDKLFKDDLGKFDRYFKVATKTPEACDLRESPFSDVGMLSATKEDVQKAVDAIRSEYKDKLDENGNEKSGILATAAKGAFSFLTKNEGLVKLAKTGGFTGFMAKLASYVPGVALAANIMDTSKAIFGKLTKTVKRFFNHSLTALESVRFKTYGLPKTKSNLVSSLRNLEEVVSESLVLSGNGIATFNGDINKIFKEVGSDFGISSLKDEKAESWMKWFNDRFLPVFLSFMGSGFQLTGKKLASEIEPGLKEVDKYNIAVRLSGTNEVWNKDASPWADEPDIGVNPDDCKDNIALLKEKADKEVLDDPKKQAADKAANAATIKSQMVDKPVSQTAPSETQSDTGSSSASQSDTSSNGISPIYDKYLRKASYNPNSSTGGLSNAIDTGTGKPQGGVTPASIREQNAINSMGTKQDDFASARPGSMSSGVQFTGNKNDVKAIIADAAQKTGVDVGTMTTFAGIESGLNPSAKAPTSSATGLFQFISDTWKTMIGKFGRKYNLDPNVSPTDPYANALMGGEFLKENTKALAGVKSNPSATDLYLAHFLGAGGAKQFLSANPSDIAANVMPKAAGANRSIFFDGSRGRTIAEVYNLLHNKVRNVAMKFGINLPNSGGISTNNINTAPEAGKLPTTAGNVDANQANSPMSGMTQPPRTTNARLTPTPSVMPPTTSSRPGSIVSAPPTVPGTTSASSMPDVAPPRTQNMNIGSSEKAISNIDTTLTETLTVQKRMLDFIQQIASNTAESVKNAAAGKETTSGGASTPRNQTPETAPKAPINLMRTA